VLILLSTLMTSTGIGFAQGVTTRETLNLVFHPYGGGGWCCSACGIVIVLAN